MKIRGMTDKEIIETLNKLKSYFDSPFFENRRSVINALETAIEAVENKEDSEKLNKSPFGRVGMKKTYYYIGALGDVLSTSEDKCFYDNEYFENCNYFNDKKFAEQVMLHQLLYRKLLKFKLERDIDDGFDDNDYVIYKNHGDVAIFTNCAGSFQCNAVVFKSLKIARLAVKEVVNPFMEEHPDFIWNM